MNTNSNTTLEHRYGSSFRMELDFDHAGKKRLTDWDFKCGRTSCSSCSSTRILIASLTHSLTHLLISVESFSLDQNSRTPNNQHPNTHRHSSRCNARLRDRLVSILCASVLSILETHKTNVLDDKWTRANLWENRESLDHGARSQHEINVHLSHSETKRKRFENLSNGYDVGWYASVRRFHAISLQHTSKHVCFRCIDVRGVRARSARISLFSFTYSWVRARSARMTIVSLSHGISLEIISIERFHFF